MARPRLAGKERDARGRIKRRKEKPTSALIEKRMLYVSKEHANLAESGNPLGILKLRNLITQEQSDALTSLLTVVVKYYKNWGATKSVPRAVNLASINGIDIANDLSDEQILRTKERYETAMQAMGTIHNWRFAYQALVVGCIACIEMESPEMAWVPKINQKPDMRYLKPIREIADVFIKSRI